MNAPYFPQPVFGRPSEGVVPRVFAAPAKYVQGPGVLDHCGRYLGSQGLSRVGVLASARGHAAEARRVADSLAKAGVESSAVVFGGECSLEEIERCAEELRPQGVDALIAVGGGKCVDAGKCIAGRIDAPVVIVPTLASNDAPTSSIAVLYTPDGVSSGAEFFRDNPLMVIVDTAVVAAAPPRYLVAGIGDAMATWYEARVCFGNPAASNMFGARPTLAATAIAEICARTLYDLGPAALEAVAANRTDDALEKVVEACTLLSGLGFESGGLAAAHGAAQGLTVFPDVEQSCLHGELVAIGTALQLALEDDTEEANRAAEFFAKIGLPVHLGQVGLDSCDDVALERLVQGVLEFQPIQNVTGGVDAARVREALVVADRLGQQVAERCGDAAWRALRG